MLPPPGRSVGSSAKEVAPSTSQTIEPTRLERQGDRPAIGCWWTSLLPVLSSSPWEGNVVRCVLTTDTRLAHVELLGSGTGVKTIGLSTGLMDDAVRHENDGLPGGQPVHARERQPRAVPNVPEEHLQNTDGLVALKCTARQERQRRGTITIGNPVHRACEPTVTYLQRGSWSLLPFTPRLFSTSLTFRSDVAILVRFIVSPAVCTRLS